MSRAYNYQQQKRAMTRARRLVSLMSFSSLAPTTPEQAERQARQLRDQRKPCSCQMCRNPRTSAGCRGLAKLTMQERRAKLSIEE